MLAWLSNGIHWQASFALTKLLQGLQTQIYLAFVVVLPFYCSTIITRQNLRVNKAVLEQKRRHWLLYWIIYIVIEFMGYPVSNWILTNILSVFPEMFSTVVNLILALFWLAKFIFLVLLSMPATGLLDKLCIHGLGISETLLEPHIEHKDDQKPLSFSKFMKFQKQIAALVLCINKVVNETAPTKSHIKKIVTGEVKTVTKVTARKVKDKITYKKTPEANPLQNDEHTGQQTATSSTNQVNQNQNMVTEPSLPKSDSQRRTICTEEDQSLLAFERQAIHSNTKRDIVAS